MKGARRGNPEADLQRSIVRALRFALPVGSVVHACNHEQRGSDARAKKAQAIGVGMGVHPGFSDLVVVSGGRVMFFEIKFGRGEQSDVQREFQAAVERQGFPYVVVRSIDAALAALARYGFATRIVS